MTMLSENIFIFIEKDALGRIRLASMELVSAAHKIAAEKRLFAIVFNLTEGDIALLSEYGFDTIVNLSVSQGYISPRMYARAITNVIKKYGAFCLLISSTILGRDVAGHLSALLENPMLSNVVDIQKQGDNTEYVITNPIGNHIYSMCFPNDMIQLLSVRPGSFQANKASSPSVPVIESEEISFALDTLELIKQLPKNTDVDLENADVVVAGGRGVGGPKGFELLQKLADCLGGKVAASRIPVDNGWIDHDYLIGQSGKIIAPKLYIACGIAGHVQHLVGMRNSSYIVSINTDPRALIYDVSDVCVVGDYAQILPYLIDEISKVRQS